MTRQILSLGDWPAAQLNQQAKDPAGAIAAAPPNFGQPLLPNITTVTGRIATGYNTYTSPDEALRHSRENARFMRNECGIMECLEARQRGTALLKWQLIPEDEKSQEQRDLCDELTKIIERIPDFLEYRRNLLEALWYGRYAISQVWGWNWVGGKRRSTIRSWAPKNGDKLVFGFDDGQHRQEEGQVGIRIGTHFGGSIDRVVETLGYERRKVRPAGDSLAYWLDPWERDLLAIHRHIVEDGDFWDTHSSGSIYGVGIRSRIYWSWYSMQECLAMLMEFMERSALGVEIWRYPSGNAEAEAKTRKAAEERIGGGRSIVLVPVPPGDQAHVYDVDHIEPGMAGAAEMKAIIMDYFGHKIKRYILGQTLTSEAEATGLGSGVADAHLATYWDIVRYDAIKLGETITTQLVEPLKRFNFPAARNIHIRFVINTETPEVKEKLEAWRTAFDMGLGIRAEDVANLIGATRPDRKDEVLSIGQMQQQAPQSATDPATGQPPELGGGGDNAADRGNPDGNQDADLEALGAMLASGKFLRPGEARKYETNGRRWITLGAQGNKEGEKKGGFPVLIDADGTILAGGPAGMRGSKVSNVKDWFDRKRAFDATERRPDYDESEISTPRDREETQEPDSFEPDQDTTSSKRQPKPEHRAVANRYGIPPEAVQSLLETPALELHKRDEYAAPSNTETPTSDFEKFPLGTAMLDEFMKGNSRDADVSFLKEVDPNDLELTEAEDGVRKRQDYQDYVAWMKQGIEPPPIYVMEREDGKLNAVNRRRTLAAREAGINLKAWFSPINPETGNPLKYGDILDAAEKASKEAEPAEPEQPKDKPTPKKKPKRKRTYIPPATSKLGNALREAVGSDPKNLAGFYEIVKEVGAQIAENTRQYNDAIDQIYQGQNQKVLVGQLGKHEDASTVPGFDQIVERVQKYYPHLLSQSGYGGGWAADDPEQVVFDMLKEGKRQPPPMHSDEVIGSALDYLASKVGGPDEAQRMIESGEMFAAGDIDEPTEEDLEIARRMQEDPEYMPFHRNGRLIRYKEEPGLNGKEKFRRYRRARRQYGAALMRCFRAKYAGGWITIGHPDRDGGGTRVYVDADGTIQAGPDAMQGRNMSQIDSDPTDNGKRSKDAADSTDADADTTEQGQQSAEAKRADWKQNGVRSKAFKDWFGDWESDPASASKVVDPETGEPQEQHGAPRELFHGTTAMFDEFDPEKSKKTNHVGRGFYFTTNRTLAGNYYGSEGRVISAFMRITNPFDFDKQYNADAVDNMFIDAGLGYPEDVDMTDDTITGLEVWKALSAKVGADDANAYLQKWGFDGIKHVSSDDYGSVRTSPEQASFGDVWIAFEPNQIKSTSNEGTFDPSDNRMDYRRRTTPRRYAGGRWITIGHPDRDGGGTRVYLDENGNITAGPEGMQGRHISDINKPSDARARAQEKRRETDAKSLSDLQAEARANQQEADANRGPAATEADEPFSLTGTPKRSGSFKSNTGEQQSLFGDGGAEERDLPGQSTFLDDDKPGQAAGDQPTGKVGRFSVGSTLSEEQKREVLKSLGDVYRDAGLKRDRLAGYDRNGDPIYRYPIATDTWVKSDITGRKMRNYITLEDGRKAHPTELFPNITPAEVDAAIVSAQISRNRGERNLQQKTASSVAEANEITRKNNPNNIAAAMDQSALIEHPDGRFARIHNQEELDAALSQGFSVRAQGPQFPGKIPEQASEQPGQKRAAKGGEYGPNGEWYPPGSFIATTEMPKRQRDALKKAADKKVQVGQNEWAVPEPGKISIMDAMGPAFGFSREWNEAEGGYTYTPELNAQAMEYYRNDPDTMRDLFNRFAAGEKYVDLDDYGHAANFGDIARAAVAGHPIKPEAMQAAADRLGTTVEALKQRAGIREVGEQPAEPEKPKREQKPKNARQSQPIQYARRYDYGCAMLAIPPGPLRSAILNAGQAIPRNLLADDGRETAPHITLLYGLARGSAADVRKAIGNVYAPVTIEGYGVFPGEEQDVIYLKAEGEELHRLNQKLQKLPNESDHETYTPHVTVAYVEAGKGKEIAAKLPDVSGRLIFTRYRYSE